LSLKAEKNWHQNKGAKRRVSNRDEDMAISPGQSCIRSIDRARWPLRRAILAWSAKMETGFAGRDPGGAIAKSRSAARHPYGAP
jgi:hypothetical protein